MRLRVCMDNPAGTRLPINYQEFLTAAVYDLLATSDADYARHLHDEGYKGEDGRRFKLFTFSWLRGGRRQVEGDTLRFAPGPLEWQLASPVSEFLTHLATGLLGMGTLRVGSAVLPIIQVETLPAPFLSETTRFTCLSPIVAALPLPGGGTRYLRPADGMAFSQAVHHNLQRKHCLLYGELPADDRFALTFDPAYLVLHEWRHQTDYVQGYPPRRRLCPLHRFRFPGPSKSDVRVRRGRKKRRWLWYGGGDNSPDEGDGITGKNMIHARQSHAFHLRLREKKPVKRVFMMMRQRIQCKDVIQCYGQEAQALFLLVGYDLRQRHG